MKGTTSLQPRRMKMTTIRMAVAFLAVAVLGAVGIAINQDAQAQSFMPPDLLHVIDPLSSLKSIPVPEPRNIARYIKDRNAAIALGKALFWDMAVGSDGQSCGSCQPVEEPAQPGLPRRAIGQYILEVQPEWRRSQLSVEGGGLSVPPSG